MKLPRLKNWSMISRKKNNKVVDLGTLGRTCEIANHALVSLQNFSRLLIEITNELQKIGLKVMATICYQGIANRTAIKLLVSDKSITRPGPYFYVNSQKVLMIFDSPHILKYTRNAFLKYNIEFGTRKISKIEHMKRCFATDKKKRFQ